MSLAIVSEITQKFKAAVAKWQVDISEPLECRFLLRNGTYVGHVLTWGSYRGVWFCEPGEMKVFRDQQWLLTMPLHVGEEFRSIPSNAVPSNAVPSNVVPSNAVPSNAVPSNAVPATQKSAA